jgi:O-antigen/teichoic acid export membrane protein
MTFGFWNMISSLGVLIRKSSDVLILNRFASPIDVDSFHLASLTDNQIDAALAKLAEPIGPHMVALHTNGALAAMQRIFIRGGRYCLWAALFVATPLIAFRHQLWLHYLGSRFEVYSDVPIVMVLLLARYWFECPICFLGMAAYAMQRVRTLSLIIIAYAVTNVVITVYFVHFLHMGAIGSAAGTLLSVLLWVPLAMWRLSLKLLGMKFGEWFRATVWRGTLPSVVAGLFGWGWRSWIQPETIPDLLLAAAVVASVYLLSILLFCLDEDERLQLKQIFEKISLGRTYKSLASWNQS